MTIEIEFEGKRLEAQEGESLAATLTAHGIRTFRTTRSNAERGIFCGMGVCQDCLVEVDGRPNERACMTVVDRSLAVNRESHLRPLKRSAEEMQVVFGEAEIERPEILIIGAGPGGLSAAIAARRAGAKVVVCDERAHPGGQFFKQLSVGADPDAQHLEGASLIDNARRLDVDLRTGVNVFGAFPANEFLASANGRMRRFLPGAAIIATGAYERAWPVPGWTLPGVMTTGAAQTLWRTARRLPGKRVLIAGNGPLNLQLAAELISGGAEIVAVVEAAQKPGLAQASALLSMLMASPGLVADGLRYHAARRSGRTPMIHGEVVTAIERTGEGLSAMVGQARQFDVDVVCLGYGFEPSNELLRMLGCSHDYDPQRRHLVTRCDPNGLTTIARVYALGDCTGLGGARIALAQGTLAGLAAAESLGHGIGAELAALREQARSDLARHRRFQKALWEIYAAPAFSPALSTPETLICRCEEVRFAEVEAALGEGLQEAGAIKRRTRIGMGRCQGRYCAPILDTLLAERFNRPPDEFSGFAPRPPAKPVRIGDLVS